MWQRAVPGVEGAELRGLELPIREFWRSLEKKMKDRLVLSACLLFATSALLAQQAKSNDAPPSKEEVLKFFDLMQVRQQTQAVIANTEEQVKSMTRETVRKKAPNADPQQIAQVEGLMDSMFKEYPIAGILDDMIPVYQKHLTRSDLDGLIAFYSSPLGQKILREMPSMTDEAMQVSYAHIQKNMEQMMKKIDARVQQIVDEQQKKKSTQAPKPKQK